MLLHPVLVAVAVPGKPATALGVELLTLGVLLGLTLGRLTRPATRASGQPPAAWLAASVFPALTAPLGLLLAGLGTITGSLGGLDWLPLAIATAQVECFQPSGDDLAAVPEAAGARQREHEENVSRAVGLAQARSGSRAQARSTGDPRRRR